MNEGTFQKLGQYFPYKVRRVFSAMGLEQYARFSEDEFYEVYPRESLLSRRFYNFGAGGFQHRYWSNIEAENSYDERFHKRVDIPFDFTGNDTLPVASDSAEICYTSHVIEHLRNRHVAHLFSEAYRITKPGGLFRVTCPDFDVAWDAYERNDLAMFGLLMKGHSLSCPVTRDSGILHYISRQLVTPGSGAGVKNFSIGDLVDKLGRNAAMDHICALSSDEYQKTDPLHINWFTCDKVVTMLREAGFDKVEVSAFGKSRANVMRDTNLFDNTWPHISLYVEATKSQSHITPITSGEVRRTSAATGRG